MGTGLRAQEDRYASIYGKNIFKYVGTKMQMILCVRHRGLGPMIVSSNDNHMLVLILYFMMRKEVDKINLLRTRTSYIHIGHIGKCNLLM